MTSDEDMAMAVMGSLSYRVCLDPSWWGFGKNDDQQSWAVKRCDLVQCRDPHYILNPAAIIEEKRYYISAYGWGLKECP